MNSNSLWLVINILYIYHRRCDFSTSLFNNFHKYSLGFIVEHRVFIFYHY
nr:MAG TPA: hypothetical protein [Caudoviricetes sp.]